MLRPRFVIWMFSVGVMILGTGVVHGQDFPNKPIRIMAGEAGGGGDFAARLIAQGLTASWGQPIIVENRGGSIINAAQPVARAPSDGYTLLIYGGTLWIGSLLEKAPYDPVADFAPITLAVSTPNVLVVHPSLPVRSVKDLIALAKVRPGELNYGSGPTGSSNHLAPELFNAMAGVNIVRVPYKGTGPALNDLIGGRIQIMFANAVSAVTHVKSGRLRAVAVSSAKPSALTPGLPTIAATVPGYESASTQGIFAPAGTSATIINRLNQEIVRVLSQPPVKQKLFDSGVEVVGSTPEELAAIVKSDMARIGKLIKDGRIKIE